MSASSTALAPPGPLAASLALLGATLAALVAANSDLAPFYKAFLAVPIEVKVGPFDVGDPLKNWVKSLLMAVFFLGVALEINAEFREGALADRKAARLPVIAAAGGMAVPAAIFVAVVGFDPELARGWAIPSATDIAFALGVVGLLGNRVPPALKAFLLAVAVIDDLGAIAIIAVFYTETLHATPLAAGAALVAAMVLANLAGTVRTGVYLLLGAGLWLALAKSGVSPTLAGVATAAFVPMRAADGTSPLHALEQRLQAPIAFFIMPVFAFANAGVALGGVGSGALAQTLTAGIILGLVVGKPLGIAGATWLAVRSGLAEVPEGAGAGRILGAGCIAGIGFTMSLFVGSLAYAEEMQDQVRLGVLTGSLVSACLGAALLAVAGWRGIRR